MRGKTRYLPKDVVIQLERIKTNQNLKDDSEALRVMVDLSKIGFEVKNRMKKKKNLFDEILEGLF